MKTLWSLLASVLALSSMRPQMKASADRVGNPGPTEFCQDVIFTPGDKVDRKAFEHKQKIRAWFLAHGLWAEKPDKRPRIWVP